MDCGVAMNANQRAMNSPDAQLLAPQATPPTPPVILLVEDEPIVREITSDVLSHAGYQVLQSGGPREALRLARTHPGKIHLLLTDVVMPEMNGAELAECLLNEQPGLITVFMSGYGRHDFSRKMSAASAVHIQKPFTMELLLTRVAEALQTGLG